MIPLRSAFARTSTRRGREAMPSNFESLLSPEALQQALWRQRAQADRSGYSFAFLRLRPARGGLGGGCNREGERLARLLCRQCRACDVPGWYGDGSDLGLILPYVTQQEALVFLRRMEDALAEDEASEVECEFFVYPETFWLSTAESTVGALEAEQIR